MQFIYLEGEAISGVIGALGEVVEEGEVCIDGFTVVELDEGN